MMFQEMTTYKSSMEEFQEYDSFNIENFYTYCKQNPLDLDSKMFKYLFCDCERSKNLDELIIGFWIKNH
jgi:hypothetical protein